VGTGLRVKPASGKWIPSHPLAAKPRPRYGGGKHALPLHSEEDVRVPLEKLQRSRKPLCVVKAYRGFESLPLRLLNRYPYGYRGIGKHARAIELRLRIRSRPPESTVVGQAGRTGGGQPQR
jgi:hypothetical protein